MSLDSIVALQRKMGENCEAKVKHWKKEIETVKGASLLLKEVKDKQVGHHEDDEMRVDIDFSEENVKSYKFFEPNIFKYCQEQLSSCARDQDNLTDLDLAGAADKISRQKLPYYR